MSDQQWSARSDDIDHTVKRSALPQRPATARIRFDDGVEKEINGRVLLGRDPVPTEPRDGVDSAVALQIDDAEMGISKTHAEVEITHGRVQVRDLNSTNGSVIVRTGIATPLGAGTWTDWRVGDRLVLGGTRAIDLLSFDAPSPLMAQTAPLDPDDDRTVLRSSVIASVPAAHPAPPPLAHAPAARPAPASSSGRRCNNCGDILDPGAAFCVACGHAVDAPPQPTLAASPRARRRLLLPAIAAIVVLGVAVGAVWYFVLRSDETTTVAATAASGWDMPRSPADLYTIDIEGYSLTFAGTTERLYLLASDAEEVILTAYDASGGEIWSDERAGSAEEYSFLEVIGDTVVFTSYDDEGRFSLTGVDSQTGEETWSERLRDGYPYVFAGGLYVEETGSRTSVTQLDPASGNEINAARLDGFVRRNERSSTLIAVDGRDVSVYDTALSPVLENVRVDRDDSVQGYADGRVIAVQEDELVAYDEDGEAWRTATRVDPINYAQPLANGRWLVQGDDEWAIVSGVGSDRAEEIVSGDGSLSVNGDGSMVSRYYTGTTTEIIVYDADGQEVYDFESDSDGYSIPAMRDAAVTADGELIAIDVAEGDELWTEDVDEADNWWVIDGGYVLGEGSFDSETTEWQLDVFGDE